MMNYTIIRKSRKNTRVRYENGELALIPTETLVIKNDVAIVYKGNELIYKQVIKETPKTLVVVDTQDKQRTLLKSQIGA